MRFSEAYRAPLRPILEAILPSGGEPGDPRFRFQRQVLGYYYYVEVYRYEHARGPIDVVFEEADLAKIEAEKASRARSAGSVAPDSDGDDIIHELIFHPDGALSSTWQPWDGVLLRA